MCGIAGYAGNHQAAPILFELLKGLEYRGYDSAGIAVLSEGHIAISKTVGVFHDVPNLPGDVGIGHNRWATHGEVSERNAHPHISCDGRIAVVHNGTIENFLELRTELTKVGHKFRSDTDTEVIAHLLEERTLDAALRLIKGTYALLIVRSDRPGVITAVSYHSPLMIARMYDGVVLASSPPNGCAEYRMLNDGEMLDVDGSTAIDVSAPATLELQSPGHSMLSEIKEQPDVILKTAMLGGDLIKQAAIDMLRATQVVFTASGTSRFAALIGRFLLSCGTNRLGDVMSASEFPYFASSISDRMTVVAVSQSGETADVLNGIRLAKEKGARTLAITNSASSQLSRTCDLSIVTPCGPEYGVAATKTFTGQSVVFYLLLGAMQGKLDDMRVELGSVAETVRRMIAECSETVDRVSSQIAGKSDFYYLGRGINFAVAGEAALKLKEVSYIHAEGLSAGELKHGTLALIDKGTLVCGICPDDYTRQDMVLNLREVKARSGTVIGISDKNDSVLDYWIPIPKVPSMYYPLLCTIVTQLLAYNTAVKRGLNPDRPRNLAKSVTVL